MLPSLSLPTRSRSKKPPFEENEPRVDHPDESTEYGTGKKRHRIVTLAGLWERSTNRDTSSDLPLISDAAAIPLGENIPPRHHTRPSTAPAARSDPQRSMSSDTLHSPRRSYDRFKAVLTGRLSGTGETSQHEQIKVSDQLLFKHPPFSFKDRKSVGNLPEYHPELENLPDIRSLRLASPQSPRRSVLALRSTSSEYPTEGMRTPELTVSPPTTLGRKIFSEIVADTRRRFSLLMSNTSSGSTCESNQSTIAPKSGSRGRIGDLEFGEQGEKVDIEYIIALKKAAMGILSSSGEEDYMESSESSIDSKTGARRTIDRVKTIVQDTDDKTVGEAGKEPHENASHTGEPANVGTSWATTLSSSPAHIQNQDSSLPGPMDVDTPATTDRFVPTEDATMGDVDSRTVRRRFRLDTDSLLDADAEDEDADPRRRYQSAQPRPSYSITSLPRLLLQFGGDTEMRGSADICSIVSLPGSAQSAGSLKSRLSSRLRRLHVRRWLIRKLHSGINKTPWRVGRTRKLKRVRAHTDNGRTRARGWRKRSGVGIWLARRAGPNVNGHLFVVVRETTPMAIERDMALLRRNSVAQGAALIVGNTDATLGVKPRADSRATV